MNRASFLAIAAVLGSLTAACSGSVTSVGGGTGDGTNGNGTGNGTNGNGTTNGNGGACSFSVAPNPATAVDTNASQQAQAEATVLLATDRAIGAYLRGDVLVYRGTMSGSATRGLNATEGPDTADYSMTNGDVIASLSFAPASSSDWTPPQPTVSGNGAALVVQSATQKKHVAYVQYDSTPGTTAATSIGDDREFVLLDETCSGCAPSLFAKPADLAFHFTASGTESVYVGTVNQGGMQTNVAIKSDYTQSLTLSSPCTLTPDDLALLNSMTAPNASGDWQFAREGNELVWHAQGAFDTPGTQGKCYVSTPYTIDVAVSLADLGKVTTRNFALGTATQECPP